MPSYKLLLLLLIIIVSGGFQCDEECEIIPKSRRATFSVDLSPELSNFSVGDTLRLSTSFDVLVNLLESRQFFDLRDGHAGVAFSLFRIKEGNRKLQGGLSYFTFDNTQGIVDYRASDDPNMDITEGISLACSDTCKFDIGLIPQEAGFYALQILNGSFQDATTLAGAYDIYCLDDNRFIDVQLNAKNFNRTQIMEDARLDVEEFLLPSSTFDNRRTIKFDEQTFFFKVTD